jgi:glycosyltransferase involved in cell wall biosynthesis
MSNHTKLYGVLVTYRKPTALTSTLERLAAQSRRLDRILVVDNGSSLEAKQIVEMQAGRGLHIEYLDAGANLGPAGGFALGMEVLLDGAAEEDWIFLFDDDDPPFFDNAVENAAMFAKKMVDRDPQTGGVGISGGRFDPRRGRVTRIGDDEIGGAVPVDHITGGGLPAYRVKAVRHAGVFLAELFFGFEELEYGLRLSRSHHLYADGDGWRQRKLVKREAGLLPSEEVSARRAARINVRLSGQAWRRFYSLRNLVYLLRRSGHSWVAIRVALGRGLIKPLVNLPFSRGSGVEEVRMSWRAVHDGWRGRMGRTVDPPPPVEPQSVA